MGVSVSLFSFKRINFGTEIHADRRIRGGERLPFAGAALYGLGTSGYPW